jgi:hypothetical protein
MLTLSIIGLLSGGPLDHAANGVLTFLKQLHELSSDLGDLVGFVTDQFLVLDGLIHVSEGLVDGRHAFVKTGSDGLVVVLEVLQVGLAKLLVDVEDGLDTGDAVGEDGDGDVADILDGLGHVHGLGHGFGHSSNGSRHRRSDFCVAVLVRQ